ncbi:hypothetical protein PPTG_15341 [Phytophthora nicotianae INRA-310]|uniref:Uncharacterized protein n=1 Tax=Phytophthora nicotianae (strain INRA-310) TaxID=761204 RepID=W2PTL0_PHYN3|nr:hypothetical protein PPTG_15341 [Phytophthora nicotianae INRA-310]ETN03976.1 hypothetical protein PPTG_15341 [Phytophthora nicotianae INRA-310]
MVGLSAKQPRRRLTGNERQFLLVGLSERHQRRMRRLVGGTEQAEHKQSGTVTTKRRSFGTCRDQDNDGDGHDGTAKAVGSPEAKETTEALRLSTAAETTTESMEHSTELSDATVAVVAKVVAGVIATVTAREM